MDVNTAWNPVCVPEPTLAPVVTNTCAHKAMCHEYQCNNRNPRPTRFLNPYCGETLHEPSEA